MGTPLHVLFVEDNASDAELVLRFLTRAGYDIDWKRVENASDTAQSLKSQAWDVVLSDYDMPGFGGPAALELYKLAGLNIPFIVLSGAVGEETVVKMIKLGAHDYVMKGNLTRLVPAIERGIQEAKIRFERVQIEKNLALERYLLQALLDHLPDRLYFNHLQSRFIRVSQSLAKNLGLNHPAEALGKTDFDFFAEEHARPAFAMEQEIIATGQAVVNHEEMEIWTDGRVSWVNTTKMPLLDANGKITGTFGLSSDVNLRKRTEILLQARMHLLDFAAAHSLAEFLEETLDRVGEITGSPIGFYHFVGADQTSLSLQAWSTRTLQELCKVEGKRLHYALDQAGVWVDAVKQHRPVIHNDYSSLLDKKGMPEGHAVILRQLVVPIIRKGAVVAILGIGNKSQDYTGQDVETVTYLADIAWEMVIRKQAETAIQESQQFLQEIIDALSLHLCVLNDTGTIIMVNRAWRDFAEANPPVPPDYCVGMNYLAVCDAATGPFAAEAGLFAAGIRSVMRRDLEEFSFEYSCDSPGGIIRWFNARVTRFEWKGARRVVISHANTTQRKLAEDNARENEARYRAVAETAHDAIITSDSAEIIVGWNRGARQIFGWEANEAIGQPIGLVIPAEYLERAIREFRGQNQIDELRGVRKDGAQIPLEVSVAEWQTNQGLFYTAILRDISQRKMTEESLHLRVAAIEAADNAIVIMNEDTNILWTNPAFTRLTGYSLPEVMGKTPDILRSGKHDPAFYQDLANSMQARKIWRGELINRRKDGSFYYEEMSITPVTDSQGKLTRFIAIKKDVTPRKIAEQALLEEKERYRSLYEDVPVGIYRTTPEGKILMANPALVHMLGYETFAELAELNLEEGKYEPGFSRANFKQKIEQDGSVQGLEIGMKRKDGSTIFIRENAHVVLDPAGQVQYYEGTIEDITEIRRSEQQNLRLAAAIEHAGETVILSDQSGLIQYANPAFKEMFGFPAGEMVGKNILTFGNAHHNQLTWQAILSLPHSGQVWRGDIRINHADGAPLDIETTISPVMGLSGDVSSLVFVMHNVTQERKAEIQQRQSQKLQAIGHLAAGIAHEINTPTQFIGNNLRFLQHGFQDLSRLVELCEQFLQGAKTGPDLEQMKGKIADLAQEIDLAFLKEEIPAAIDGSLTGIDRVTRIVSAMKEFSHPAAHEKVIADINHAIENTLVVSHNEWKYAAEMVTDLDPALPQIPCLVDEFNQVILNLITNAVDAIQEAKAAGQAEEVKGIISISTRREDGWITVKVADNGRGMAQEIRDRVFDPFFTTKEVGKGTGQGLSISYDVIVTKHGGKISFETEEGKGTTFTIQLPI